MIFEPFLQKANSFDFIFECAPLENMVCWFFYRIPGCCVGCACVDHEMFEFKKCSESMFYFWFPVFLETYVLSL